jgi:hypothetical protein
LALNAKDLIIVALLFQAGIEGLEQCPFCPFAAIMVEPKEVNKVTTF